MSNSRRARRAAPRAERMTWCVVLDPNTPVLASFRPPMPSEALAAELAGTPDSVEYWAVITERTYMGTRTLDGGSLVLARDDLGHVLADSARQAARRAHSMLQPTTRHGWRPVTGLRR